MQNKIYFDTNILIDYLNKSRECNEESTDIIEKCIIENNIIVTNNLNLNTIFFILADRANQYDKAKEFLNFIENSKFWQIYDLVAKDRHFALSYMDENHGADFEDLLQYSAAKSSDCILIVTNDKDFPKLDISLKRTNPNIEDYTP